MLQSPRPHPTRVQITNYIRLCCCKNTFTIPIKSQTHFPPHFEYFKFEKKKSNYKDNFFPWLGRVTSSFFRLPPLRTEYRMRISQRNKELYDSSPPLDYEVGANNAALFSPSKVGANGKYVIKNTALSHLNLMVTGLNPALPAKQDPKEQYFRRNLATIIWQILQ